jgi:hypothetical protein
LKTPLFTEVFGISPTTEISYALPIPLSSI